MVSMPEIVAHVVLPDEGEAGSAWRLEKLKDFQFRARVLGLEEDPAFALIFQRILDETEELEQIWEKQKQPDYNKPWWQDGEYDANRADEANDKALGLFKNKEYSQAFDLFTDSIRLCPTSPVYHCNRAAAALKLGRPDIAVEDAENALARNPQNLKALIRGAEAYLALLNPTKARIMFEKALEIEPSNRSAVHGVARCCDVQTLLEEEEIQQQHVTDSGQRLAIPRNITPEIIENFTLLHISAEHNLKSAHKKSSQEAALCAKIEALIVCGRYVDALSSCRELREGVERRYLESEALWRSGQVSKALENLRNDRGIKKCAQLEEFLQSIIQHLQIIENHKEEEMFVDVIEECTAVLSVLDALSCTELYCSLLCDRARAHAHRRQFDESRKDITKALELHSNNANAIEISAHVNKMTHRYVDYFLDAQKLKTIAPSTPGLSETIEDAAILCLEFNHQNGENYEECGGFHVRAASQQAHGPQSAFETLGLNSSNAPTLAQVRQAYLRLATEHHPDKWSTGSEEERLRAEERFKSIQGAYALLTLCR